MNLVISNIFTSSKMFELSFIAESVVLILLVSMMILYMIRRRKMSEYLQLPGPTGIPIFGNFFQLDKMNMHLTLDEWAYKYGDMFRFRAMGHNFIVINSSAIVRELVLKEPLATLTAGRMPTFYSKYITNDQDLLTGPYNDEWIYRRKTGHQQLRAYGEGLRDIEKDLTSILESVRQKIQKSVNKIVDPSEYVDMFLLENLEHMVSGERGNTDLQKCMVELDNTSNTLAIPSLDRILYTIPILRYMPGYFSDVFKRCIAARDEMMNILNKIHKDKPTSSGMYGNLIQIVKNDEKKKKRKITIQIATYIIQNMVGAGYLTTHGSLMSILKILISKPQVQTKIQREIGEVIGSDRLPQIRDRENCPYTEAVILESLRYISHVPLVLRHSTEQFEFKRIKIPKNCNIFLNLCHINHNEKEFEDPFQFKPERFLGDDGTLLPATAPERKRLLVFGLGKRSCIGEVFARSRTFLFLAHVMQKFSVVPPTGKVVPLFHPTEMNPGIILHPTNFNCKFVRNEMTSKTYTKTINIY